MLLFEIPWLWYFEMYRVRIMNIILNTNEPDIVKRIRVNTLRWVGHVERLGQAEPTKFILYQKPMCSRPRGRL